MDGRLGIPLLLLAGALIILGVALGSGYQKETFIGNELQEGREAGSDPTVLTSFLAGVGAGLAIFALGKGSRRDRWIGAVTGGIGAWFLLALVQLMAPNYVVLPDQGSASIILSNLLLEEDAAPSILLPVIALGILLMTAIAWAMNRSDDGITWTPSLAIIRRDHLGVAALAIPVLVVTAAGMLRVMLELPPDHASGGLIFLLHPLAAAACLALVVTITLRAQVVARLRHDPSGTEEAEETWKTLNRIDLAGITSLALVAVLASFLPAEVSDATSAGNTLLFTLRSHGQAVLFLAVILVPLYFLHRRIGRLLPTASSQLLPSTGGANRSVIAFIVTTALASTAAVVVTFAADKGLMPWVVAIVPPAIAVGIIGRPRSSALVRLVGAWTMWGLGNTIVAFYDSRAYPDMEFLVHPGILALWRMAAAAMVAWVVFDVLKDAGDEDRQRIVVPLSLAAAVGIGLVGLLELPLTVWAEATIAQHKVAVGSLLVSQQAGVQVIMHLFASVCALGAAMSAARILRPDWFRRRRGEPVAHGRSVHATA